MNHLSRFLKSCFYANVYTLAWEGFIARVHYKCIEWEQAIIRTYHCSLQMQANTQGNEKYLNLFVPVGAMVIFCQHSLLIMDNRSDGGDGVIYFFSSLRNTLIISKHFGHSLNICVMRKRSSDK